MEVLTSAERELAEKIAQDAMLVGWEKAISKQQRELDIAEWRIEQLLTRALDYNAEADPSGRIHELEDWGQERMGRSSRGSGFDLRSSVRA